MIRYTHTYSLTTATLIAAALFVGGCTDDEDTVPDAPVDATSDTTLDTAAGDDTTPETDSTSPTDTFQPDVQGDTVQIDTTVPDDTAGDDVDEPDLTETDTADDAQADTTTPEFDVPVEAAALQQWLIDGNYLDFASESAIHASTGPHGRVRIYVNPTLENATDSTNWPIGSAAIKELYNGSDELTGWAVEVKINDDSSPEGFGDGWYWYEVFSTEPDATPVADGTGAVGCTGCHSAGNDFVRVGLPLD
jgi:hypothetical protein